MSPETIQTDFIEANGLKFEVDQCGNGDKLALFLHGFPEHSFSWRYQLPFFARMGYTAWAPNMRGYGNSSCPTKVKDYAVELLMVGARVLVEAGVGPRPSRSRR